MDAKGMRAEFLKNRIEDLRARMRVEAEKALLNGRESSFMQELDIKLRDAQEELKALAG